MPIRPSTGLRNYLLDTNSLDAGLAAGFIRIYSGTPPADADAAVTGTLLCTISIASGGTGINMAAAATGGVLTKAAGETWSGVNAATGTATYYRHVQAGDTGVSSTTERRIQGTVGTVGTDLELNSVSLTSGATQTIDFYSIALPAS